MHVTKYNQKRTLDKKKEYEEYLINAKKKVEKPQSLRKHLINLERNKDRIHNSFQSCPRADVLADNPKRLRFVIETMSIRIAKQKVTSLGAPSQAPGPLIGKNWSTGRESLSPTRSMSYTRASGYGRIRQSSSLLFLYILLSLFLRYTLGESDTKYQPSIPIDLSSDFGIATNVSLQYMFHKLVSFRYQFYNN
uniref:Uncharacterized protein n=1 Tax=Glossina brevipalpis TaxID=37001 RepID=A0A1A9WR48_9MUSC